jgi:hypothetical protein
MNATPGVSGVLELSVRVATQIHGRIG